MTKRIQSVNPNVKTYYESNWESIANCYDLNSAGIPIDAAWYRRRIYRSVLNEKRPSKVLDIGCGGGQTVLDAFEIGAQVIGLEPVPSLVDFGKRKLSESGFNAEAIAQGDASDISRFESSTFDLVAMLSVIPHIPYQDWPSLHMEIQRVLKPGGYAVIAYRNELFDLYTENRFTHEFFMKNFYSLGSYSLEIREKISLELEDFIPRHNVPSLNHTESKDKRFGLLDRPKSNPLTQAEYLANYGLTLEHNFFCNIHPLLPNSAVSKSIEPSDLKHQAELAYFDKWQGNFMGSMFVSIARKD